MNIKEENDVLTVKTTDKHQTVKKSGNYQAIIFYPQMLTKQNTQSGFFNSDSRVQERIRVAQVFQIVDPFSAMFRYMTILVHPGTNIGMHIRQESGEEIIQPFAVEYWQEILNNPLNQHIARAFEIIYPDKDKYDNLSEPGYRNFKEADAIKLVQHHFATKWVDRALIGETRPTVLKAANDMKLKIAAEEQARTA